MGYEKDGVLMTIKEAAEYLRVPLPTAYYLVQLKKLPAFQIQGRWRVKRSALESLTHGELTINFPTAV